MTIKKAKFGETVMNMYSVRGIIRYSFEDLGYTASEKTSILMCFAETGGAYLPFVYVKVI